MQLATPAPLLPPNGQAPDTLKEYISFLSAPYRAEATPGTSGSSSNLEARAEANAAQNLEPPQQPNVVTLDGDDLAPMDEGGNKLFSCKY